MMYNSYYPASYQQYQFPQQNQQSGVIWVQGEAGAKSYLVAPNSTVVLFDSESQSIFLKSADASGMPSMKVLDYTIRSATEPPTSIKANEQYSTKDDFDTLQEQINALKSKLDKLTRRRADDE